MFLGSHSHPLLPSNGKSHKLLSFLPGSEEIQPLCCPAQHKRLCCLFQTCFCLLTNLKDRGAPAWQGFFYKYFATCMHLHCLKSAQTNSLNTSPSFFSIICKNSKQLSCKNYQPLNQVVCFLAFYLIAFQKATQTFPQVLSWNLGAMHRIPHIYIFSVGFQVLFPTCQFFQGNRSIIYLKFLQGFGHCSLLLLRVLLCSTSTPASTLCNKNIMSFNISGFKEKKTTFPKIPHDNTANLVIMKMTHRSLEGARRFHLPGNCSD